MFDAWHAKPSKSGHSRDDDLALSHNHSKNPSCYDYEHCCNHNDNQRPCSCNCSRGHSHGHSRKEKAHTSSRSRSYSCGHGIDVTPIITSLLPQHILITTLNAMLTQIHTPVLCKTTRMLETMPQHQFISTLIAINSSHQLPGPV
jgi:hypothetical protein